MESASKLSVYSNIQLPQTSLFPVIAALKGSAHSDLIYVAHLITPGAVVHLYPKGVNLDGSRRYAVRFDRFNLGYIDLGRFAGGLWEPGVALIGEISAIIKRKNLPPSEIDICLKAKMLQKLA